MIKLSKKVEYALIALVDLAAHSRQTQVTTKDLAERYQIPVEILGKVLQALARNGILHSAHGVKGGYTLADHARALSINTIIEAVDGPIALITCKHHRRACEQSIRCNIKTPMSVIQQELVTYFNGISLQDIKERCQVGNL